LRYWITETGIDGFRCDVGMMVPDDFWNDCIAELKKIKPDIFMLVEGEDPQFIKDGFHMTYAWENHHAMNKIAQGKQQPELLDSIIRKDLARYSAGSYFMNFTSNHDENSWNGTEFERMGDAAKTFAVAAATIPGMFLVYSGQEVALDRRLKFFDKDSINWVDNRNYIPFYTTLFETKKDNPALWNGNYGGNYKRIDCGNDNVYCYSREKDDNKVLVILNMSSKPQEIKFTSDTGNYKNVFGGKKKIKSGKKMELTGWQYMVLTD